MRMPGWLESAWVARYLDRQLTDDENAWFEAYVLDKPDLLEAIDVDTLLGVALTTSASGPGASGAGANRAPSPMSSPGPADRWNWMRIAASLVVGLGVGWIGSRVAFREGADIVPLGSPTRIVFDTLRGAADTARIENADSKSPYTIVEVSVPANATDVMWRLENETPIALRPSADGFVTVLVPSMAISRGQSGQLTYVMEGKSVSKPLTLDPSTRK